MNKSLFIAWITAILAMLGSLYFSEIKGYTPCELCWYQRILMYPLVIILGIAFYHNDKKIYRYVMPLSIFGIMMSGYHYGIQKFPFMSQLATCTKGVDCSNSYTGYFGFITIPLMAFVAFVIITICMVILSKSSTS